MGKENRVGEDGGKKITPYRVLKMCLLLNSEIYVDLN